MKTASWVIREKATGRVIAETFNQRTAMAVNRAKYEAVPILDHLIGINRALKLTPADAGHPDNVIL